MIQKRKIVLLGAVLKLCLGPNIIYLLSQKKILWDFPFVYLNKNEPEPIEVFSYGVLPGNIMLNLAVATALFLVLNKLIKRIKWLDNLKWFNNNVSKHPSKNT